MTRILLATDGSPEADAARRVLQALPLRPGTFIRVLCVVSDRPVGHHSTGKTQARVLKQDEERARRVVAEAAALLRREAEAIGRPPGPLPGVTATTAVTLGDPIPEILRVAQEWQADLVTVGSRGLTGLEGFLLGSVARGVAHNAGCPVLVARFPRNGIREVLVTTDGSERAAHAIDVAADFPLPEGARLTVVHVAQGGELPGHEEALPPFMEAARERLERSGRDVAVEMRAGQSGTEILALAEERQADLIVTGARGASLIEGLLVGSVADHLLKEARCSVLVVR